MRERVDAIYGVHAGGRNVCTHGRKGARGPHARARYLHELLLLAKPDPYLLKVVPGTPAQWPGGAQTVHYAPVGLALCIANAESGNGRDESRGAAHEGVAQWAWGSPDSAWVLDSGLLYADRPTDATYDEQMLVLSYGLVHFACSQWCPFDPC